MKNKPPYILTLFAVGIGISTWVASSMQAKAKLDRQRNDIISPFRVATITPETSSFLAGVQKNWIERANDVNGPHAQALKTIGRAPSVANLVQVFTCRIPEYAWFSPKKNIKSALLGRVQGAIIPRSVDNTVQVSSDGHLAMIRCAPGGVYVFEDDPNGLRERLYFAPKDLSNQARQAISTGNRERGD